MKSSTTATGASATSRARRSHALGRLLFLGPGLLYLVAFVVVPLGLIVSYTVFRRGRFGGIVYEFTWENFARLDDSLYRDVVLGSLKLAAIATLIALLVGYPTAYLIAQLPKKWKTIALVVIVMPFWTNFLVRIYAWVVLLSGPGLVNSALLDLGLIDKPLELLYNQGTVVTGLVYSYLPLMILPLYAAIEKLDPQLREASANLGAGPVRTFFSVTLPLTLPGVLTGSLFVFVPSFGNFIIPELLGGGRSTMVGNVIRDQFLKARDWPFGATLTLALLVVLIVLLLAQAWSSRRA
ncbi:spermidine/putrescine transport system permease protein [Streptosporangium becharense]|uniref:Spermidine/putrescine transport system permease protein n=1 Tax=Streptosporangium becharense TaxID=1816182 RepID=A0A7W9MG55_9ACTN|nr:ABC transporter permease [Streptosporangium becharense]MBB2910032.1 spermidine/putrescine transport system permease protein [Streptosporangium becharense]MBB5819013.1 spermidine/putrescine transport system permease protein [Streptosporangium becharense]